MTAEDMQTLNDLLTATREGRLDWDIEHPMTTSGPQKRPEYRGRYKDGGSWFNSVTVSAADPVWVAGFGPHVWIGSEGKIIWTKRFSKAGQIVAEIYNTAAKQVARRQAESASRDVEL